MTGANGVHTVESRVMGPVAQNVSNQQRCDQATKKPILAQWNMPDKQSETERA